jgi:hypothetical protein
MSQPGLCCYTAEAFGKCLEKIPKRIMANWVREIHDEYEFYK